jgi:hypothetical protein
MRQATRKPCDNGGGRRSAPDEGDAMVAKPRRIRFDDFAKSLDAVFDEVAEQHEPVLVERQGRLYRLESAAVDPFEDPRAEYDPWANYDPEKVLQALEALRKARIFEGIDVEQFKADIKAARSQDSRGRPGD